MEDHPANLVPSSPQHAFLHDEMAAADGPPLCLHAAASGDLPYGQSDYDVTSSWRNVSPYNSVFQNGSQGLGWAPTVAPAYGQNSYDVANRWSDVTPFHGDQAMRYPCAADQMYGSNTLPDHDAHPVGVTHANAKANVWASADDNANSWASSSVVPTLVESTLPIDPSLTNTEGRAGAGCATCSACGSTFGRRSDLQRHEEKHQPSRPFRCVVAGCGYKGSYRKDKLEQHVRNRNQSGHGAQR